MDPFAKLDVIMAAHEARARAVDSFMQRVRAAVGGSELKVENLATIEKIILELSSQAHLWRIEDFLPAVAAGQSADPDLDLFLCLSGPEEEEGGGGGAGEEEGSGGPDPALYLRLTHCRVHTVPQLYQSWAVIAGICGEGERNTHYRYKPPGTGNPAPAPAQGGEPPLRAVGETLVGPGSSVAFMPGDINSTVLDASPTVPAMQLHLYGRPLAELRGRIVFDEDGRRTEVDVDALPSITTPSAISEEKMACLTSPPKSGGLTADGVDVSGSSSSSSSSGGSSSGIVAECFDHVAIGVANLEVSREWYSAVLGFVDFMQHEKTFVGPTLHFIRQGGVYLALLALGDRQRPLRGSREQKGHFALRVSGEAFWSLHARLPALLEEHKTSPSQSTDVLCDDFGVQLSMFFFDPDGNEVEIATWDCERDDSCSRFGKVDDRSIRGNGKVDDRSIRGNGKEAAAALPPMRAAYYQSGGDTSVLQLGSVPRPSEPGAGEFLVRIIATSVNPVDFKLREARGKGTDGPRVIPGADIAGVVEQVGPSSAFVVGQRVFAMLELALGGGGKGSATDVKAGSCAEFAIVKDAWASPMPAGISFEKAAALPLVSLTACQAFAAAGITEANRDEVRGKRILIHAAAGGVGSFAVQLACHFNLRVSVTCSAPGPSEDLIRSLCPGRDVTIVDYRTQNFWEVLPRQAFVLDLVGGDYELRSLGLLGSDGVMMQVLNSGWQAKLGGSLGTGGAMAVGIAFAVLRMALRYVPGFAGYTYTIVKPSGDALRYVAKLVEDGVVRPLVDRCYDLDQVADAHDYLQLNHAKGKVVLRVVPELSGGSIGPSRL